MRAPHFIRLAQIDEQRFITACRHGLVHLTWGRITVRFRREEFQQLAGMVERAADGLPPVSLRVGEMCVTTRFEDDCELQIGSLALLLSPAEFEQFVQTAQEAAHRLDEILASGMWDREEPEEAPPDFLERLRRSPFSDN